MPHIGTNGYNSGRAGRITAKEKRKRAKKANVAQKYYAAQETHRINRMISEEHQIALKAIEKQRRQKETERLEAARLRNLALAA